VVWFLAAFNKASKQGRRTGKSPVVLVEPQNGVEDVDADPAPRDIKRIAPQENFETALPTPDPIAPRQHALAQPMNFFVNATELLQRWCNFVVT
jgi:hypothetical protein